MKDTFPYSFYDSIPDECLHPIASNMSVVAQNMGVEIFPSDVQYWHTYCRFIRVVDTYADQDGANDSELRRLIHDAVEGVPIAGYDNREQEMLIEMYPQLPDEKKKLICKSAELASHNEVRRVAGTTFEVIKSLTSESKLLTDSMALWTPYKSDSVERERYNQFLGVFLRAGYYIDAGLDMNEDYKTGLLTIEPTFSNRAALLVKGLQEMKKARGIYNAKSLLALTKIVLR